MGFQLGYSSPMDLSDVSGDENLNYPNAATSSQLLSGTTASDAKLEDSHLLGFKIGHYFEKKPFLGIEGELFHTQPNFKTQTVRLEHADAGTKLGIPGATAFHEAQRPANVDLYTLAFNVMFRYQDLEKYTPYVGIGPAIYHWRVSGTGTSCEIIELGNSPCSAPDVSENATTFGINFKFGSEYEISEDMSVGLEYKYNYADFELDQFRSMQNIEGKYKAQAFAVSLIKRF